MQGYSAPCLANLLASSFPMMIVWALILRMVILWWEFFSMFIGRIMRSLFRWMYWEDVFLMWLRRRHMLLLRLFVNTNIFVRSILVCSMAIRSACNLL
jgi:hypothetical protein